MNQGPDPTFSEAVRLFNAGRPAEAAAHCLQILAGGDLDYPLELLAIIRLNEGRLADAADCYRRLIALKPDSLEAHENLGLTLVWQKHYPAALASFQRALAIRPGRGQTHNNIGNVHLAQQRFDAAIDAYRKAATIEPTLVAAHFNLGVALAANGRHSEAIASYRAALALDPDLAAAHNNLGIGLRAVEEPGDAVACFRRAIALRPDFAEAHNNLGNALEALEDHEAALDAFRRAAELKPDFAEAHHNLANALSRLHRYDSAIADYTKALAIKPDFFAAQINLGNALFALKRYAEALGAFRAAIELKPDQFTAHLHAGNALFSLQRYEEAVSAYRLALALEPGDPDALRNLGNAFLMLERYDEALASHRQTLEAIPDDPTSLGVTAYLQRQMCEWTDLARLESVLLEHVRTASVTVDPFIFLALTDDPALQLACARQYWRSLEVPSVPHVRRAGPRHRKLRLGYLSGNFRTCATAFLTAQLFELHDRSRFEVLAFSYGPDEDSAMRRRLKLGFDRLFDLQHATDDEVVGHIREQEVDIVIDLKGYQKQSRMALLARRPAPVQVHYICHPGTLGVDFIDYAFVDRFLVPQEQEAHFTEKLVFLPDTYLVTDQKREVASRSPTRSECGLPEDGFVFCCFNNTYKITPQICDVWARLLQAVPGSALWLIADNRWAEENLRREMRARGIDSHRVVFAPRVRLPDHLARHRLADLFIDTWPYCAHTTATDALWAGLPLLTLTGRSFASRVAGSLLRASGLPELITESIDDYERLALRLAREPDRLADARRKLSGDLTRLAAFDTPRMTRNIEAAYERMWQAWEAGDPPRSFAVDASRD